LLTPIQVVQLKLEITEVVEDLTGLEEHSNLELEEDTYSQD
jgi:hypothetical protein